MCINAAVAFRINHISKKQGSLTIAARMHISPFFVFACLVGSMTCALHKREADATASVPDLGSGSAPFDVGSWWTSVNKDYGPDKWASETQSWFDKAPSWLQFGNKKE